MSLAVVVLSVLLCALLLAHTPGLNGPYYFQWPWKHMGAARTAGAAGILIVHAALLLLINARRVPFWLALVLLLLSASGIRLGISTMSAHQAWLDYARDVVSHPGTGSFVTVAQALRAADWRLEDYPEMTRLFPAHASNKPPGPTMFWLAMLQLSPDQRFALNLGLVIVSLLGAGSAVLCALWALQLGATRRAALHVGSVLSLLPGTFVFFPLFDAVYATLAMMLVVTWTQALVRRSVTWSIVFGGLLSAILFCCFQILPIGWLLACEAFILLKGPPRDRLRSVARLATVSVVTCVVGQVLLRLLSGYDVIHMFRAALENQNVLMQTYGSAQRPYPLSIPWDLYDFVLGAGYLALVPAAAALFTRADPSGPHPSFLTSETKWVCWSGIALLLIIAGGGLLPGETARVWNFLYPVVALPAGLFVAGLSLRQRLLLLGCQTVMLLVMVHSMTFISVAH